MSEIKKLFAVVVDPDRENREVVKAILDGNGIETHIFTAWVSAENFLVTNSESPDLLILEEQLQGVNGSDIWLEFKKENPNTKCIIMGDERKFRESMFSRCGIAGFLPKPLEIDEMLYQVVTAFNPSE